jgi:hypothetical protein
MKSAFVAGCRRVLHLLSEREKGIIGQANDSSPWLTEVRSSMAKVSHLAKEFESFGFW